MKFFSELIGWISLFLLSLGSVAICLLWMSIFLGRTDLSGRVLLINVAYILAVYFYFRGVKVTPAV